MGKTKVPKMAGQLNRRFIMITLTAILCTVVLSAFVYYQLFKREVFTALKTDAQIVQPLDTTEIIADMKKLESQDIDNIRITVISKDGDVVYDNNANIGEMENHSSRPEFKEAEKKGEGQAVRTSHTLGKNTFYYAVRLDHGYVLRTAKEAGSLYSLFSSVFPAIALISVVMSGLCILLSHIMTKNAVRPIRELAGNLEQNQMTGTYEELIPFIEKIRRQHDDLLKSVNIRQEFTANVSHELKTPLTAIAGYAGLIENHMVSEEESEHFAHEIDKNAKRLLTLINDIIRLSELDQGQLNEEFQRENLREIGENAVEMLKFSAEEHDIAIAFHGNKNLYISGNRQMLEEVAYNLCENAIRYNHPQGTVDVTVKEEENQAILEVKDTGIGISKKDQKRVFERFYRVDKSRSKQTGGTGLGLAIVKHIVALHPGAEIRLESELQQGTTIQVRFPLIKSSDNIE